MYMHAHAEPNEKMRLREATAVIMAGGITNGILGVVKIVLGSVTGYLPLTASGVHSLSDIVSDVVAWVAVRMGSHAEKQGEDVRFHYGRRRIETLLALFAAFLLAFVSVELIMSAFGYHDHGHGMPTAIVEEAETHGIEDHDHDHDHDQEHAAEHGEGGLGHLFFLVSGVIIISVIAKEILFRVTRRKGISLNSPMLIAKAWHHRADSISALAVLLSIFISSYFPAFALINPVTTVVIAGLILHSAWEVGSNAVKELIDFAPSLETIALIEEMAEEVAGVTFTHNIRIRSMGGALYVELTAETDPELTVAEGYAVVKQIREKIMDKVPNVIDVSTLLTPKGEYIRQFLGSET